MSEADSAAALKKVFAQERARRGAAGPEPAATATAWTCCPDQKILARNRGHRADRRSHLRSRRARPPNAARIISQPSRSINQQLSVTIDRAIENRQQKEESNSLRRALSTMSGGSAPIFQSAAHASRRPHHRTRRAQRRHHSHHRRKRHRQGSHRRPDPFA